MGSTPISSWRLTGRKAANDEASPSMNRKPSSSTTRAKPMPRSIPMTPGFWRSCGGWRKNTPDQIVKKDRQTFLVPKRCVSVREPYSAERRKAASERAKAAGYRPPSRKLIIHISSHFNLLCGILFAEQIGVSLKMLRIDIYKIALRFRRAIIAAKNEGKFRQRDRMSNFPGVVVMTQAIC